ncbi:MAG: NAD-dependent epimerase/dehydratase family protein [Sphingomonadales bacterium]|nr:NAD-dependent epimerase/dehydratase family protein [Sphingomonadales bacterium]
MSRALADRFARLVVIDNMLPQVHPRAERPRMLDPRAEFVIGDVTRRDDWAALLARLRPDVIVHLAAETGTAQSLTEATRHAEVNVVGTTMMLDALAAAGALPRRIVLSSSRAVYGEGQWRDRTTGALSYPGQRSRPMLEAGQWDFPNLVAQPFEAAVTVPRPTSVYGATKLAQEHILSAWGQAMGVETPMLRLQNVYGPGQSLTNPYTGIVPLFARIAKAGDAIPVYEDGAIIRDFVFIDDVAAALVHAASEGLPSTLPYDVGLGEHHSIHDLARLVARLYDAPEPVVNGKFRHGDVRAAGCSIARTERDLGWRPKVGLADGVAALCRWIDTGGKD